MSTEEETQKEMTELNNTMLAGRTIVVKEAHLQENRIPYNNDKRDKGGYRSNNKRGFFFK